MFRLVPPAGAPVSLFDLIRSIAARTQYELHRQRLEQKVSQYSKQKHCFFVDSGRTAMFVGLKALTRQADAFKNEVVIPAYTCFTVPAAVVRSGLKVRPVDIDPMTMDYDYARLEAIDFGKVLAVVGNNLFGIPTDWNRLQSLAREKAVHLIDDSAQAFGLSYAGEPLGSFGDFGFYSLGRGKNLSAYSGGILVTGNDPLAQMMAEDLRILTTGGLVSEFAILVKTSLLAIFLHPRFYWIPANVPLLKLGETIFDPNFAVEKLSPFQIALTNVVFEHLDKFNDQRRENAGRLINVIKSLTGYEIPGANGGEHPTYLRLPVLTEGPEIRDRLTKTLRKAGISASPMYPSAIHRIPGIGNHMALSDDDFPGADQTADKLVTLPTHPYLGEKDIARIAATLAGA